MKNIILVTLFTVLLLNSAPNELYSNRLDEYLKIAAENNPGLQAKFSEYNAALQRVPQAGALPDPQLSFGIFIEPMERYMGDQTFEISLMQMFPWFGVLGAAKNEAALMAKAKFAEFKESKSMLHYEVKATWYLLYLREQEITILEDNLSIINNLEEIALIRFQSADPGNIAPSQSGMDAGIGQTPASSGGTMGGMSGDSMQGQTPSSASSSMDNMDTMSSGTGNMVSVLRIQMEKNELENRLQLMRERRVTLTAKFNKLLYRQLQEPVLLPETIATPELPLSLVNMPDSILIHNPMLKMLAREEEAFAAMRKMNRRMSFPMIGIGLQYSVFEPGKGNRSMMNGDNMLMPMVTVSIPLWRKKYNAAVREAEFNREAVIRQLDEVSNDLLISYREAADSFQDADRRWELYRKQADLGQQVLDLLIVDYSTGKADFAEVLRMQQQLLNYKLQQIEAKIDGHIASAMLERLMGR